MQLKKAIKLQSEYEQNVYDRLFRTYVKENVLDKVGLSQYKELISKKMGPNISTKKKIHIRLTLGVCDLIKKEFC